MLIFEFTKCSDVNLKTTASILVALAIDESQIEVLATLQPIFNHLLEALELSMRDKDHVANGYQ